MKRLMTINVDALHQYESDWRDFGCHTKDFCHQINKILIYVIVRACTSPIFSLYRPQSAVTVSPVRLLFSYLFSLKYRHLWPHRFSHSFFLLAFFLLLYFSCESRYRFDFQIGCLHRGKSPPIRDDYGENQQMEIRRYECTMITDKFIIGDAADDAIRWWCCCHSIEIY